MMSTEMLTSIATLGFGISIGVFIGLIITIRIMGNTRDKICEKLSLLKVDIMGLDTRVELLKLQIAKLKEERTKNVAA